MTIASLTKRFRSLFPRKSYGLNELDLKLTKYLLPIKDGFFIEAGAHDGISQSNTYLYEKKHGWKGLLVEPIPSAFQKCRSNREAIVENYALGPTDGETLTIKDFGLMSIVEYDGHEQYIENALKRYGEPNIIEVPVLSISTLLKKHGVEHVDFFSLDVETYEIEVLKGLGEYRPTYILMEDGWWPERIEFMKGLGYSLIAQLTKGDSLFKI